MDPWMVEDQRRNAMLVELHAWMTVLLDWQGNEDVKEEPQCVEKLVSVGWQEMCEEVGHHVGIELELLGE
jgi:hypothetical protein